MAVLRHVRHSRAHRRGRRIEHHWSAAQQHFTTVRAVDAEEHTCDLRPTRSDQSSEADDLAGANAEADVRKRVTPRQAPSF